MRPTVLAQFALAVVALVTLVGCQGERCTSCESAPSGRAAAITAAPAGKGHDHGSAGETACKSPAALVATIHPTKGNTAAGVVRLLGGLAERYFPMYYEDVDLCFEIRRNGRVVRQTSELTYVTLSPGVSKLGMRGI